MQSFPHAPDVFALLKELAVMRGEPAAPLPSTYIKQEATSTPKQTDYQVMSPSLSMIGFPSLLFPVHGLTGQKQQLKL